VVVSGKKKGVKWLGSGIRSIEDFVHLRPPDARQKYQQQDRANPEPEFTLQSTACFFHSGWSVGLGGDCETRWLITSAGIEHRRGIHGARGYKFTLDGDISLTHMCLAE